MVERHKVKLAVYLILREGNKVLLSQRQNTGWKDGWFSLVAGHVEAGEAAEESMVREAKEEAGITVSPNDLRLVFTLHRLADDTTNEYIDLGFECTHWDGEVHNTEPEKCGELRWVDMHDIPDDTLDYVRFVLEQYPLGVSYASTRRK